MDKKSDALKNNLTPEQQDEVSEYGDAMHSFYQIKPEDRNRIIDGIHSLNAKIEKENGE